MRVITLKRKARFYVSPLMLSGCGAEWKMALKSMKFLREDKVKLLMQAPPTDPRTMPAIRTKAQKMPMKMLEDVFANRNRKRTYPRPHHVS